MNTVGQIEKRTQYRVVLRNVGKLSVLALTSTFFFACDSSYTEKGDHVKVELDSGEIVFQTSVHVDKTWQWHDFLPIFSGFRKEERTDYFIYYKTKTGLFSSKTALISTAPVSARSDEFTSTSGGVFEFVAAQNNGDIDLSVSSEKLTAEEYENLVRSIKKDRIKVQAAFCASMKIESLQPSCPRIVSIRKS